MFAFPHLMLSLLYDILLSHVTVADWCGKLVSAFDSISRKLVLYSAMLSSTVAAFCRFLCYFLQTA